MTQFLDSVVVPVLYLLSAVLFILGIKGLTRVRTAQRGNALAALAMLIAIVTTLLDLGLVDFRWIIAGLVIGGLIGGIAALRVEMTAMPEMVALFNGFGGGASALVASSIIWLAVVEPTPVEKQRIAPARFFPDHSLLTTSVHGALVVLPLKRFSR